MTPEHQFDAAFDSAFQDRLGLVSFLEGVSEEQARWSPPDGEWTILEGLEHILLTEQWFRSHLLQALTEAETSGKWATASPGAFKMTLEALRRREQGRVDAPPHLLPIGRTDFGSMTAELLPGRATTREALRAWRGRDLSLFVVPSPRYGALNVYERIAYSGIHDALHQEQMERVTRQPGYPSR